MDSLKPIFSMIVILASIGCHRSQDEIVDVDYNIAARLTAVEQAEKDLLKHYLREERQDKLRDLKQQLKDSVLPIEYSLHDITFRKDYIRSEVPELSEWCFIIDKDLPIFDTDTIFDDTDLNQLSYFGRFQTTLARIKNAGGRFICVPSSFEMTSNDMLEVHGKIYVIAGTRKVALSELLQRLNLKSDIEWLLDLTDFANEELQRINKSVVDFEKWLNYQNKLNADLATLTYKFRTSYYIKPASQEMYYRPSQVSTCPIEFDYSFKGGE